MSEPVDWLDELRDLCDASIEGRLTDGQRQRLEQLVLGRPEARRVYAEYLHQHACLHWSAADPALLPLGQPTRPAAETRPARVRRPRLLRWGGAALAASVLAAVGLGVLIFKGPRSPGAVATLAESKACKWESGTLPTQSGARLGAGRLRLAEGLAHIVFDQGAEVTLEGPADLELLSARHCVLHAGRLVARVSPPALGFLVDTPSAVLKDLGTEFGVHVHDEGTADVQVFKGLVDVEHRATGRTERMPTGKNLRFGPKTVAEVDPAQEKSQAVQGPAPAEGDGTQVIHLTTALGRGRDAYVQPKYPSEHASDVLSLVKNTVDQKSDYLRKAYLAFDLAALAGQWVTEAQLTLTFVPTEMGFASEVPDATFRVYGLTDEGLDGWDERTLRWHTAPANRPGGAALDPDRVVLLGTFELAQGVAGGARGVAGPALVDFLNRDTNGLATLIVVRETKGSGRNDLVHGYANKHHPQLPPPTLRLSVVPRRP